MKITREAARTNYAHNRFTSSIINRNIIVIILKNLVKDHNTVCKVIDEGLGDLSEHITAGYK